jgi:hypothetical protein
VENTWQDIWQTTNSDEVDRLLRAIQDPQDYHCGVIGYMVGHRQMLVKVEKFPPDASTPIYLGFEPVWYFEGPLSWQGIDFRVGSIAECKELLCAGWLDVGDLLDEFVRQHILLVLERPKYRVRILTGSCGYLGKTAPNIHISYPKCEET